MIKFNELNKYLTFNDYVIIRQGGKSFTYAFNDLFYNVLYKKWSNRLVKIKKTLKSNIYIVEA